MAYPSQCALDLMEALRKRGFRARAMGDKVFVRRLRHIKWRRVTRFRRQLRRGNEEIEVDARFQTAKDVEDLFG